MRLWVLLSVCVSGVYLSGFHGFPPPTFTSDWLWMSSVNQSVSYRVVSHDLGQVPVMVKVWVRVPDGPNKDYIFEASSGAQTDDDYAAARGGVIYAYTNASVHLWTPTRNNDNNNGFCLYIGGIWGSGEHSQRETDALVRVQVWSKADFYPADYESEEISIGISEFKEIHHNFEEIPSLMEVVGSFNVEGTVFFFEGSGSLQSKIIRGYDHTGEILFAYSATTTRLWTRPRSIFFAADGWGAETNSLNIQTGTVRVLAWKSLPCLSPITDSDWFTVNENSPKFHEFTFPKCTSYRHVDVKMRAVDGNNNGYIFQGTGTAQSAGDRLSGDAVGGVVFAHTEDTVRVWTPNLTSSKGHLIMVSGVSHSQVSDIAQIRVRVWCGNVSATPVCPSSRSVPGCGNLCPAVTASSNSSLMVLSSQMSASFLTCVRSCMDIRYCSVLSWTGDTCSLHADKQFGNVSGVDINQDLYRFTYVGVGDCQRN